MIETIYIEKKIKNHPRTKSILKKFKKSRFIEIDKYAEIFNKRNQNFRIQKANPNLILAHKNDGFVLRAPQGFGIGSSKNFTFHTCTIVFMIVGIVFFKGCFPLQITLFLLILRILMLV